MRKKLKKDKMTIDELTEKACDWFWDRQEAELIIENFAIQQYMDYMHLKKSDIRW